MESQSAVVPLIAELPEKRGGKTLVEEVWVESKKLWEVTGPAAFTRMVLYSMTIVSQAFAGHLGDRHLAAFSIANTVISGLNFGILLGMASALETLCGQAYGAKQYSMMGTYLQRSWLVLLAFAVLLAPTYIFSGQLLMVLGQPAELSREAGLLGMYLLPLHLMFAIQLPLNKFLQCQRKNWVIALSSVLGFPVHVVATWLLAQRFQLGVLGAAMSLNLSWVLITGLQLAYAVGGGCPETWRGFASSAFMGLKDFVSLSVASGVMTCLESWYYRLLIFLTAYAKNAELAVDALSICLSWAGWEMMIHFGFLAGTGVRVANELGANNGRAAKFATIVSTTTSFLICLLISSLALIFHDKLAILFTSSEAVIDAVDGISVLLALTILLNGIQPVLSGVAVGSGWQALVAYVNIGSYYIIGVPFGVLLAWGFHYGVLGIWVGMIGGTMVQTLILSFITLRCDWNEEALKASSRMRTWSSSK
ncbi:hypothetical protein BDA96_02G243800 [Sorghum bicolor]|uniref:Protein DETOXIFICATION n=1 Tax=Sorghum bicolor TaxID=4558 RepID=A0A921UWF2_SORBI|nr:hypothetical protein BDA96_02G243800 [Sorghum bicolor]